MQLTRFTDYGLRVLISVGLSGERGVTIGEIAEQYGISRNHLMKVVQGLAKAGYLETMRGKGGGLRLALPAADIHLGEVVRESESLNVVPCFEHGGDKACSIAPVCALSRVVREALQAFLAVLDRYTLADLLEPGQPLERVLLGNLHRRRANEPAPDSVV